MRLVLDTNVLISSLITRGAVALWFEEWQRAHRLVTSEFILAEFAEKAVRKFRLSPQTAAGFVALAAHRMQVVEPSPLQAPVCRDPDDDWILATAVAGRCDVIISGDHDLRELHRYGDILILSPREFRDLNPDNPHPPA